MKRSIPVLLATLALVAGACGDDDESSDDTTAGSTPVATEAPAGEGEGLALATTDLGDVIVDAEGMTMYMFMPDAQGDTSQCNDDCAAAWPPQAEIGAVGGGLDATLLGTITRADGSVQGTYNRWPLYSFSGDAAPGDVNGQGLNGVWWVIDATGTPIET